MPLFSSTYLELDNVALLPIDDLCSSNLLGDEIVLSFLNE